MICRWRAQLWIFLVLGLLVDARPARATIDYDVSVAHPEKHVFGITMRVPNVHNRLTVQMPAWTALYQIRDFSAHMMQVSATDKVGSVLSIVKLDKQTWQITGDGAISIRYSAYWDEPGPFSSQLNLDHAFLNLAMVLLYIPDRRGEDTRVSFDDMPTTWRVAVELDPSEKGARPLPQHPVYVAPSYDALVDAPTELGVFKEYHFDAGGRPIRVVIHGDAGDQNRLNDALKRIVDYQVSMMGGAPFREYLFIFHVGSNFGGGGMEHANCTAISADVAGQLPGYSAHEFFHAWNVKRIRPQSLEPVDYTKEMWTRSLWFAEGVTSTYAAYTLVRTGLWSTQQFYKDLAEQINELESRPAHNWQSAEQSSLDAWLEKYPTYTLPEESISYYDKGQLLGVALDILIRDATDNRASLDDVLRTLNEEFARKGRFYNDSEDLRAVAEQTIRKKAPGAKADLSDFFARYVAGTEEMPFGDLLGRAGWMLKDAGQKRVAIVEAPDVTAKQRAIRNGILHGMVEAPLMIRTAIVAFLLGLYVLVVGPPLILYTVVSRSATLMYWAGVKGLVSITALAGLRVHVEGRENIPAGVCVFAANHTSNADAPAIVGAIPRRIAILARKSLFEIPVVGLAFRLANFVPVDRGNREAALASIQKALEYLRGGSSFLVYPEGTRSPDGRLQRFKKGSFAMAIEAGVPIVPVACSGAHRIMKKNSLIIHGGPVTVKFGRPIDVSDCTIDDRDDLARRVHDAIAEALPEDQKPADQVTEELKQKVT